ncbi:MAG: hypothetical protein QOH17_3321 [Pseudonocardiales bacterium]|nr:hypothetical protein [Pseudonocardiales bacterium]
MVGDEMFATEGDSVNVGRQGTATRENGRASGLAPVATDDVTVDVLRRLRDRVDRNVRLIDRMRADPLAPEPPGLPELIDTARRLRHDAETLLLLGGIDADARPGAPMRLSALLDEAVDATEEPMRVDVRVGPNATVEPSAAVELLHVVSEVVDHVTAIHPGARIEVSSRTEAPGGIVVEVRTASTTRYDPSGRRGMAAAARIAQRSRSGLVLRTPPPGPPGSGAPMATIHCPARAVSIQELDYAPLPRSSLDARPDPWATAGLSSTSGSFDALDRTFPQAPAVRPSETNRTDVNRADTNGVETSGFGAGAFGTNGFGSNGYAHHDEAETPPQGLPVAPLGAPRPAPRPSPDALFAELSTDDTVSPLADPGPFIPTYEDFGRPSATSESFAPSFSEPHANGRSYPGPSADTDPIDELFGPMTNLPPESDPFPMETPIFEAVASVWFREEAAPSEAPSGAPDWESPSDPEWRAAAERAAQPETTTAFTSGGLPRRRPGGRLVPPKVQDGNGGAHAQPAASADRVPDRVRERLATYQRGLRQGRHRAEPADPGDPAAW